MPIVPIDISQYERYIPLDEGMLSYCFKTMNGDVVVINRHQDMHEIIRYDNSEWIAKLEVYSDGSISTIYERSKEVTYNENSTDFIKFYRQSKIFRKRYY